jgi:hypothetical protein
MGTAIHVTVVALVILTILVILQIIFTEAKKPIPVAIHHGFVIDIDNDIFIAACRYHGIGHADIRWCTENKRFVFERDGKMCWVFTMGLKDAILRQSREKKER